MPFFSFCIFCFRHVLSRKPYAHQGWRTLFIFVLFGFVFLGPLGPLSVRSRRPYESLWFCANSSGAQNVEEIAKGGVTTAATKQQGSTAARKQGGGDSTAATKQQGTALTQSIPSCTVARTVGTSVSLARGPGFDPGRRGLFFFNAVNKKIK